MTENLTHSEHPDQSEQAKQAAENFYKRWSVPLRKFTNYKFSKVELDDVMQEVVIEYWLGIMNSEINSFQTPSSWLQTLTLRKSLRSLRKTKPTEPLPQNQLAVPEVLIDKETPEHESENNERSQILEMLLDNLGDRESLILKGLFLDGKSYQQIAKEIGVSSETVGPLRARALQSARRKLWELGYTSTDLF